MSVYRPLIPLLVAITLWTCARGFVHSLSQINGVTENDHDNSMLSKALFSKEILLDARRKEEDSLKRWAEVRNRYAFLRKIAKELSQVFGNFITWIMIGHLVYFAVGFYKVANWRDLLFNSIYLGTYTIFLLFATDICQQVSQNIPMYVRLGKKYEVNLFLKHAFQMDALKEWLWQVENRQAIPPTEMIILLNDLETNKVAVTGESGYPIITNSLVAHVSKTLYNDK